MLVLSSFTGAARELTSALSSQSVLGGRDGRSGAARADHARGGAPEADAGDAEDRAGTITFIAWGADIMGTLLQVETGGGGPDRAEVVGEGIGTMRVIRPLLSEMDRVRGAAEHLRPRAGCAGL